ncbi:hypothetical protein KCU65_g4810, partial [Aureobasidium melanogenum]
MHTMKHLDRWQRAQQASSPSGILIGFTQNRAPCECGTCRQQFLHVLREIRGGHYEYESVITSDAARTLLADLINKINTDRAYLANACKQLGNTIASRWRKKSRDKREALLLQADPTIEKDAEFRFREENEKYTETEPWSKLRTEEGCTLQEARRSKRKSWLLPYMSTAAMKANPLVLLGLIHHRVHHSPEEWAPFDNEQLKHGWTTGDLALEYCGHACVVMHGADYGKLVPWDKGAAERWDIVGYPRAQLILEAQALVFSRLRSIVDLILEGINRESVGASDKWQEMVRTGFKQTNAIELWSDYINQPFSSPPKFNVNYYCSVAKARMQEAQDHLWLLQTDVSYARRFIKVMAAGEVYRSNWKSVLIGSDIREAVLDCLRWIQLDKEWSDIREQYLHSRDGIQPGQPLPRSLELSLAILERALLDSMDTRIKHLTVYITQRPGFQHYYKFTMLDKAIDHGSHFGIANVKTLLDRSKPEQYVEDPLDWTLMQIMGPPDTDVRFDYAELFAKLEAHLAEADSKERERLDETLYAKFSEFATLHEMLSAVRLHRPAYARRGSEETEDMLKKNSTPFTRSLVQAKPGHPGTKMFPTRFLERFDQLNKTRPVVGFRNKAWLDFRTAEREALASFWKQACEALRTELGNTRMKQEEIEHALSLLSVSTSKEYAEMVEAERAEVLGAIAAAAESKKATSTATLSDAFWETAPDVSRLAIDPRASKQKTRPVQPVNKPVDDTTSSKPTTDTEREASSPPQIPASARALEIIKKMFPNSAEETSAKDTDWDLFVHAMNDLTFSARNVGGSAVAFEHPSRKKIIFHRPHPVAKIDSIMLQSMGKRLKKHFDWSREAFIGV